VVDNLSTGSRANLNPRADFYEADIRTGDLAAVFDQARPDVVNHHAAHADVRESVADPRHDAEVNVIGSLNVLQQAARVGARKVIFISSGGACYGDPVELPCTEATPFLPLSPYAASKAAIEACYLYTFQKTFGLDCTVLRYANIYGPRQDLLAEEGRVVAIFTRLMLQGGQPRINGNGEQQRDFVHVADVVGANLKVLEQGRGEAYNIGTGQPASINQIFDLLKEIIGFKGERFHGPALAGEVQRIWLDATKARRELGWEPKMTLEAGLRDTVDYFRQQLGLEPTAS
jgi:UDP-glucose 4-epimerase